MPTSCFHTLQLLILTLMIKSYLFHPERLSLLVLIPASSTSSNEFLLSWLLPLLWRSHDFSHFGPLHKLWFVWRTLPLYSWLVSFSSSLRPQLGCHFLWETALPSLASGGSRAHSSVPFSYHNSYLSSCVFFVSSTTVSSFRGDRDHVIFFVCLFVFNCCLPSIIFRTLDI